MAWTSKSNRFDVPGAEQAAAPADVGPGLYFPHSSHNPLPSYAPFGSTREKAATDKLIWEKDGDTPAPGDYDPKRPVAYDSGLPRKTVPFASGAPRSKEQATQNSPGPGSYQNIDKPRSTIPVHTMGLGHPSKPFLKSYSAPSIPRGHQCFGYEESGSGGLVRQGPKNATLLLTGVAEDTAGPGHYEHVVHPGGRRALGGRFAQAPARAEMEKRETPGPGHYKEKSSEQRAVSSSFLSTLERNVSVGVNKHSEVPGPGQYTHQATRPGLRELHPELQFFGSTANRFQHPQASAQPGPGAYDELRKDRLQVRCASFGGSTRFDRPMEPGQSPGPGSYETLHKSKTHGPLGTVSILGSTGSLAFGSMQSRCPQIAAHEKEQAQPGPGAYEQHAAPTEKPRQQSRLKPKGKMLTGTSSAPPQKVKQESTPPPGAYSPAVSVKDTAPVMRLPPKHEGFLSTAPRITQDSTKKSLGPGPGGYEIVGAEGVSAGKRSGTFNRSVIEGVVGGLGFDSQTKRFKNQAKIESSGPGPGAYNNEQGWLTKSHNIYFGNTA